MSELLRFFGRLEWWERPLVVVLSFSLAYLLLPAIYIEIIRPSFDVFSAKCDKEKNRRAGWTHLALGFGFLLIGTCLTWLFYAIEITWLDGRSHLVSIGAFIVGVFEVLQGLGILIFRNAAFGVIVGFYSFAGFCMYGLMHWTWGWF